MATRVAANERKVTLTASVPYWVLVKIAQSAQQQGLSASQFVSDALAEFFWQQERKERKEAGHASAALKSGQNQTKI